MVSSATGGVPKWSTSLIVAEGVARAVTGVVLEEIRVVGKGVAREPLNVYNRAFSRCKWFAPLSLRELLGLD